MPVEEMEVSVPAAGAGRDDELIADLALPQDRRGLVVFAHGSGSSRRSSRNRWVAGQLQDTGLGTVLMDLLTAEEGLRDERTAEYRFDIGLLTRRVLGVMDWISAQDWGSRLTLGLFGASTGAAAALGAAAHRPESTYAVVSRGGRPDLASEHLELVRAPTLLIVGGRDPEVLSLNRKAAEHLWAPHQVEVVEGATHLFEEPGALKQVAEAATWWFQEHLG